MAYSLAAKIVPVAHSYTATQLSPSLKTLSRSVIALFLYIYIYSKLWYLSFWPVFICVTSSRAGRLREKKQTWKRKPYICCTALVELPSHNSWLSHGIQYSDGYTGEQQHKKNIMACFSRQTVFCRCTHTGASVISPLCGQQTHVYAGVLPWCTWLSCIIMSAASSTVVIHTVRNDNSYRLMSAFMSQQEPATCEDVLHFNFLPSFSLVLGVQLSLLRLPGLFGGEECMPAVADNSSRLTDRCPYASGEDCQSRLLSHFLLSSHPSSLPERGIPAQWCLQLHFIQVHAERHWIYIYFCNVHNNTHTHIYFHSTIQRSVCKVQNNIDFVFISSCRYSFGMFIHVWIQHVLAELINIKATLFIHQSISQQRCN